MFQVRCVSLVLAVAAAFWSSSASANIIVFNSDFQSDNPVSSGLDPTGDYDPGAAVGGSWTITEVDDEDGRGRITIRDNDPVESGPSGSNHYMRFYREADTTPRPKAVANGWDASSTLNQPVDVSFDFHYSKAVTNPKNVEVGFYDSVDTSSDPMLVLYFCGDGSIRNENGSYLAEHDTEEWEDVVLHMDTAAKTFTVSAMGRTPTSGSWGYDVHQFQAIRFYGDDTPALFYLDNLSISTIPEPGSCMLLASGVLGLLAYAWRKRK